jgi:outer membrane protein assembly factor BamB
MRSRARLLAAAAAAAVALACGNGGGSPADRYATTAEAPVAKQQAACAAPPALTAGTAGPADWVTYHRTSDRAGVDAASPRAGSLRPTWGAWLDGNVFTQPLVYQGLVLVATQHDTVSAFDASRGCLAWSTSLGTPVDASKQACAEVVTTSISPELGVTGTPVVDPATLTAYVVAYLAPPRFELVALDLATGAVRSRHPIDLPGGDIANQLSRPALALANGRVYAAFGGRAGSCGNWHGYVVGVRTDAGGPDVVYRTPASPHGGSIWAPGGPVVLPNGDLLVTTGEGGSTTTYDGGNSVVRLSPDLREVGSFAPPDWAQLTKIDFDLGSVGPTLLDGGHVFQVGKQGTGYLLDAAALGGIGGQRFAGKLTPGCYAIGATAYRAPYVYVPCDHGTKALRVDGARFDVAWTAPDFRSGSPMVAGGLVWVIDFEGGYLWGLDPATGAVRQKAGVGVSEHFVSPSASDGRLFVPAGKRLLAFSFR